MLHKKFNQNLSTCFINKKLIHVKQKKCLRFDIILKLMACWEINQVTPKCQMQKRSKTEKKNNTIELYIFKLVGILNFSFNKQF